MSDDTRPLKTRLRDGVSYYRKYSNIEQLPKDLKDALDHIEELEAENKELKYKLELTEDALDRTNDELYDYLYD